MAVDVTATPALQMGRRGCCSPFPTRPTTRRMSAASRGATWRATGSASSTRWRRRARLLRGCDLSARRARRQGKVLQRVGPTGRYGQPALSPDGTRIATRWFDTFVAGGRSDIWVVDIASGKTTPITNDTPPDFNPMWSLDASILLRVRARGWLSGDLPQERGWNGRGGIHLPLRTRSAGEYASISADGKHLLFNSGGVILSCRWPATRTLGKRSSCRARSSW